MLTYLLGVKSADHELFHLILAIVLAVVQILTVVVFGVIIEGFGLAFSASVSTVRQLDPYPLP